MFRERVALGPERGEIKGFRREVGVKAEGPAGGWVDALLQEFTGAVLQGSPKRL